MKRKLWLLTMSGVILALSGPRAEAKTAPAPSGKCIDYECDDNSGCEFGCTCRFVAEMAGECGGIG
jgi:hypothetical protein